jgi:hypothetical protein
LFFLVADSLIITGSIYLSFWVGFDGRIPLPDLKYFRYLLGPKLGLTILLLAVVGLYNFT